MYFFFPALIAFSFYYVHTFVIKNKILHIISKFLTTIVILFCLLCYIDLLLTMIDGFRNDIEGVKHWYIPFY